MTQDWTRYLSEEAKLRKPCAMVGNPKPEAISLATGLPHPENFPIKGISIKYDTPESGFQKTAVGSTDDEANASEKDKEVYEMCQYMDGTGTTYFSKWCHQYIERYHKPIYEDWDTVIQSGATLSLDAIFRLLCNTGDSVLAEELTYPCLMDTCDPMRIHYFGVKMDDAGVSAKDMDRILNNWDTDEKTKNFRKPKLYYSMPVGQNPTGITMTAERKKELYAVCQKHDILIVEDDPYYHLQLSEKDEQIPSMLKYDTDGRVLRIDSFSKVMMPGLRVSIVTGNKVFIDTLVMSNEMSIHSAAASSQLMIYMLMKEWKGEGFEKWLTYIQGNYRKRRDLLLDAFSKNLPKELCSWNRPIYGMFMWLKIKMDQFPKLDKQLSDAKWAIKVEDLIYDKASKNDVLLAKGHWFMIDEKNMAGFRATYASATHDNLYEGSRRFGDAIRAAHKELYGN